MSERRNVFAFTDSDFVPVDNAALAWRWDQPTRAAVRPLNARLARTVYSILVDYTSQRGYMLSEVYFAAVELIATDTNASAVEPWLRSHSSEVDVEVLVAYKPDQVYLVDWDQFCAQWSDFCYPSSDDIVICPPTEDWILYFYHEEVFFWGRPNRKADGRALPLP